VTLPAADTVVLYPDGTVTAEARVLHTEPMDDDLLAVVLDRTPFHPVDTVWPDQGADRGAFRTAAGEIPILHALVGATSGERLLVGEGVPVRTGTDGWAFVVVHVVTGAAPIQEGDSVAVEVDPDFRAALSAGHTACHLAALALDRALAAGWTKPATADSLGAPAFDRLAIESSLITSYGSEDVYRIGKSLRRKGFDPAALADPAAVAASAEQDLARWVACGAGVRIDRDGLGLGDRRYWVCDLPEGEARIPCGGTHLTSLAGLAGITLELRSEQADGALRLSMTTTAAPR
jgi:alanyl-tRNA synthetase